MPSILYLINISHLARKLFHSKLTNTTSIDRIKPVHAGASITSVYVTTSRTSSTNWWCLITFIDVWKYKKEIIMYWFLCLNIKYLTFTQTQVNKLPVLWYLTFTNLTKPSNTNTGEYTLCVVVSYLHKSQSCCSAQILQHRHWRIHLACSDKLYDWQWDLRRGFQRNTRLHLPNKNEQNNFAGFTPWTHEILMFSANFC